MCLLWHLLLIICTWGIGGLRQHSWIIVVTISGLATRPTPNVHNNHVLMTTEESFLYRMSESSGTGLSA